LLSQGLSASKLAKITRVYLD